MTVPQIPAEAIIDFHIAYGDGLPVLHVGIKSLIINGERVKTGQLVDIPLPYLDTSAKIQLLGTRKSPKGHEVIFGFLIQE